MTKQSCRTCRWAKWALTPTGRIRRDSVGSCQFVPVMPPLPDSITHRHDYSGPALNKVYIESSDGENCPCWESQIPDK